MSAHDTAPTRSTRPLLQLVVFAAVGGAFNVSYALLYLLLRESLDAQWANAVALVVSTIAGTWGHRRVTFGVRSRARTVSHQTLGLALLGFGLGVTAGSLALLELNVAEPSRTAELVVLAAANLGVGLVRFLAFRAVMVPAPPRPADRRQAPRGPGGGNPSSSTRLRPEPRAATTPLREESRHDGVTADPTPELRDASEVGSAAARAAWADAARPVLLEAAGRYRALVSYKELATAVQEASGITTTQVLPQWLGDVLGRVTDECHSRGEPLLSALCVSVQGSVGAGYADAVERVRGVRPGDPDEHAASERLSCYRHWEAAGLPSDGGTPLRTAHFTPVKKPAARKAASRTTTRGPSSRKPAAVAPEPKPVPLCPTCRIQVPASGICDYCD